MSFLEIRNLSKRYGAQTVLDEINVNIERGEFVCVLGPSGCGKTTLLRITAGLETADSGQVFINRRDCTFLAPSKRDFGIVFQSYALFPNMTAKENIMFGLKQKKEMTAYVRKQRVEEMLELVEMGEHCDKYPRQLSGGQQQRTAIARALALSPQYLLLDEPLSALDAKVRLKLRTEIRALQRKFGITTVMVTHDQEEALAMADRVIVMNRAKVEQVGTPDEIYNKPSSRFVADFIGTMNFYDKNGAARGIRPEKIKVVAKTDSHDFTTLVRDIEFKGAFSRIHSVVAGTENEIYIDLPSDRVREMKLACDATLFLQLPDEYAVKYGLCG